MLKRALLALGLVLVCTSPIWAGTTGNGSAQWNGQYGFCFAGNPNVVYFTQITTFAPAANVPNIGVAFGDYIKTTYKLPTVDRERCARAATSDEATAEKQRYIGTLGTTKSVEVHWTPPSTP